MEDKKRIPEIIRIGGEQETRPLGAMPGSVVIFDTAKAKILPTSALTPPEVKNAAKRFDCIIPPVEKNLPSILEKADPTHRSALDMKAIATSQKGYTIEGGGDAFKKFIKKPNYETFLSFQDILDAFVYEFYVYDEAYLEILKVADRVSLFICPARYMYIKTNTQGRIVKYCHITSDGNVTELEPYRGGELRNGVHYAVHLRYYNTTSSYYGFPAYLSAIEAMLENSFIRRFGIRFFENDATPSKALVITGAMLSNENKAALNNYLTSNLKGIDNSHRILLITLDDSEASAKFQDLSKNIDGSFLDEYKKNRDEIVTAHQVPPRLLGIHTPSGLSSGSETIGSLRDFVDRTITPRQNRFSLFFSSLLSEIFNEDIKILLSKIDTTDARDEAVLNKIYASIVDIEGNPVKTVAEIREELGLPEDAKGLPNVAPHNPHNNELTDEKPRSSDARIPGISTYENPRDMDTTRG